MLYSASAIFFGIVILCQFLLPFSNAIPLVYDEMVIAFVKGQQEIPFSEYSKQKYEANLGIVYFMINNWHCDKINEKFKEYERTECQKYRKYLDILYEYLYREYVGIPTAKPKFVFQNRIEIDSPIIYAVNCLTKISQFYLIKSVGQEYEYKLNKMFNLVDNFEPKLLNEKRFNYKFKLKNVSKMPINEMILQLAIETANEWQTNESLNGIISQKYEENLEEMLKKAEERSKKDNPSRVNKINDDKHKIITYSNFDDEWAWIERAQILEIFKGLATNFRNSQFETYLGIIYVMRENWQCDEIWDKYSEYNMKECQKYRNYLYIFYEYLFRLYAEAKNPKVLKQLPPLMKPIIIGYFPYCLIYVVESLNADWKLFWQNQTELEDAFYDIDLVNVEELNYEIKLKIGEKAPKKEIKINISKLREQFDQKMKSLSEKAKENAIEAKDKLEKATSNIFDDEDEEKRDLENQYYDQFGTFNFWL